MGEAAVVLPVPAPPPGYPEERWMLISSACGFVISISGNNRAVSVPNSSYIHTVFSPGHEKIDGTFEVYVHTQCYKSRCFIREPPCLRLKLSIAVIFATGL